jgi:hypothetical protein
MRSRRPDGVCFMFVRGPHVRMYLQYKFIVGTVRLRVHQNCMHSGKVISICDRGMRTISIQRHQKGLKEDTGFFFGYFKKIIAIALT